MIVAFSVLTMWEVSALKKIGIDILGRLSISSRSEKKLAFFFEAFGAIAFIVAQPILFTVLLVWAVKNVDSDTIQKSSLMLLNALGIR
jgi:hypothetical protein